MSLYTIKRLVVLFWAIFFTIVLATNLGDVLKEIGLFSANWPFASGNLGFIGQFIAIYSLPDVIAWIVYAAIILLELIIVIRFWRAYRDREGLRSSNGRSATTAFGTAILLWIIFILADEFFIVYDRLPGTEDGHVLGLIAQVITFILVLFVPYGSEKGE